MLKISASEKYLKIKFKQKIINQNDILCKNCLWNIFFQFRNGIYSLHIHKKANL